MGIRYGILPCNKVREIAIVGGKKGNSLRPVSHIPEKRFTKVERG
jgi:hypothetical protein